MPIAYEILQYVFELHEQGIVLSSCIVSHKESHLYHIFQGKAEREKVNVIFKGLKSQAFKYQMVTHEIQWSSDDAAADVLFTQNKMIPIAIQNF